MSVLCEQYVLWYVVRSTSAAAMLLPGTYVISRLLEYLCTGTCTGSIFLKCVLSIIVHNLHKAMSKINFIDSIHRQPDGRNSSLKERRNRSQGRDGMR